jgi:hypothetical protein
MRIILTPDGSIEISELKKEFNSIRINKRRKIYIEKSNSMYTLRKKKYYDNKDDLNVNHHFSISNNCEVKKNVEKKIKKDNRNILYNMINKMQKKENDYNVLNLNYLLLPNDKKEKKEPLIINNIKNDEKKKEKKLNSISLKNILNKNAYDSIINTIEEKEEVKKKNYVMNDLEFRTKNYEPEKEKLKQILKKKINTKQNELINYLQKKKEINLPFIKKLSEMNDDELDKLNKVCQHNNIEEDRKTLHFDFNSNRIQLDKQIKFDDNSFNKIQNILKKFYFQKQIKDFYLKRFLEKKLNVLWKEKPNQKENKKIKNIKKRGSSCSF